MTFFRAAIAAATLFFVGCVADPAPFGGPMAGDDGAAAASDDTAAEADADTDADADSDTDADSDADADADADGDADGDSDADADADSDADADGDSDADADADADGDSDADADGDSDADADADGDADADADGDSDADSDADTDADSDADTGSGVVPVDYDVDGHYSIATGGDDCNDLDATVYPGATEICDSANVDEDCDSVSDDADSSTASGWSLWYRDADSDGYGRASSSVTVCDQPAGYVANATDCDDAEASVNPGATEVCDAGDTDEDCDGFSDDLDAPASSATKSTFYADVDGDGYGGTTSVSSCDMPSGYVATSTDCDDSDASVNPGESEVCSDGVDQDCNGVVDSEYLVGSAKMYWIDTDGDGYGEGGSATGGTIPCGYVTQSGDCDGSDASVHSGAEEVLDDGIDQDCDGADLTALKAAQDEAECPLGAAACFVDADGNGVYETLLMDGDQWALPGLADLDAEVYENGYGTGCGIDGDTVVSNAGGYYVVSFDDISSSCTTQMTLVLTSGSSTYWWQNYAFCTDGTDVQELCDSTGFYSYLLGADWRGPSSGLHF